MTAHASYHWLMVLYCSVSGGRGIQREAMSTVTEYAPVPASTSDRMLPFESLTTLSCMAFFGAATLRRWTAHDPVPVSGAVMVGAYSAEYWLATLALESSTALSVVLPQHVASLVS